MNALPFSPPCGQRIAAVAESISNTCLPGYYLPVPVGRECSQRAGGDLCASPLGARPRPISEVWLAPGQDRPRQEEGGSQEAPEDRPEVLGLEVEGNPMRAPRGREDQEGEGRTDHEDLLGGAEGVIPHCHEPLVECPVLHVRRSLEKPAEKGNRE